MKHPVQVIFLSRSSAAYPFSVQPTEGPEFTMISATASANTPPLPPVVGQLEVKPASLHCMSLIPGQSCLTSLAGAG